MNRKRNLVGLVGLFVLVAAMAGCGGGGGGGGDTAAAPPPPPVPSTPSNQSLVPQAAALGAVLAVNAADLRPLQAGARWEYRGTAREEGTSTSTTYTSRVRQTSGTVPGSVNEEQYSVFGTFESETQIVSMRGSEVVTQVQDPLGIRERRTETFVELRSPVRVNDQQLLLERSAVSLGVDVDRDGVADVADVAVYSTVMGAETVNLPYASRSVSAIRVDTVLALRTRRSSDLDYLPVTRAVDSTWYAVGIGPVKRTLTAPAQSGTGPVVAEESLSVYVGLDAGMGATDPAPIDTAGGLRAGAIDVAAVTGDTALLMENYATNLLVIDRLGQVQRIVPWTLPIDNGLAMFGVDDTSAIVVSRVETGVRMQRVDSQGNMMGPPTVALVDAFAMHYAWDGSALWVTWTRRSSAGASELMLQPFSLTGAPLAAAEQLDSPTSLGVSQPQVAAMPNMILVTWKRGATYPSEEYRYAVRRGVAGVSQTRTLGVAGNNTVGPLTPVVSATGNALTWFGRHFTAVDPLGPRPADDLRTRAVLLDAANVPMRTAASLDDELVPASLGDDTTPVALVALRDRLHVLTAKSGWPPAGGANSVLLTTLPASPSALPNAMLAGTTMSSTGALPHRPVVLPWRDRVFVFSQDRFRIYWPAGL